MIILDDCSTDVSSEIIEQYRNHEKVRQIIYSGANSGSTFKQWEKGIKHAEGKYIWIAESDDISDSDFLQQCMHLFSMNTNLGIVYTQSLSINEKGEKVYSWLNHTKHLHETLWDNDFIMTGKKFAMKYMTFQNSIYRMPVQLYLRKKHIILPELLILISV